MRLLKIPTLFVWLMTALISGSAIGQDNENEDVQNFLPLQLETGWTPGEQYNAVNGTMNYRKTDLHLPGNGKLPITINRYYQQLAEHIDRSGLTEFGHMQLEYPSFSYLVQGSTITYSVPSKYCLREGGFNDSATESRVRFKIGNTNIYFYPSDSPKKLLHSQDGWEAECMPNPNSDSTGIIIIRQPDGIQYEMRPLGTRTYIYQANTDVTVFQIHQISDPYGNTLTYEHNNLGNIASITANDGRKVTLSYNGRRIDKITSNSRNNPTVVEYDYNDDNNTLDVTENGLKKTSIKYSEGKTIDSITYPTGGTVNYAFGDEQSSAGTSYKTLKSRTTSDGAVYNFEFTDNGNETFVRRIETPCPYG